MIRLRNPKSTNIDLAVPVRPFHALTATKISRTFISGVAFIEFLTNHSHSNRYQSYKAHTLCVTEDQKYGGQKYQQKNPENLQGQKQQRFVECVNEIASNASFSGEIKAHVDKMLTFDNIPRKKPKFMNFIKSALPLRKESVANQLWGIVEQAVKKCGAEAQQQIANKPSENGQQKGQTNGGQLLKPEKRKPEELNGNKEKKSKVDVKETTNETVEKPEPEDFSKLTLLVQEMIESAGPKGERLDVIKFSKRLLQAATNQQISLKRLKKYSKKIQPFTKYSQMPVNDFYEKLISKMKTKKYYEFDKCVIKFNSGDN